MRACWSGTGIAITLLLQDKIAVQDGKNCLECRLIEWKKEYAARKAMKVQTKLF